jgi:parvulin-like peptidyl-prolyl isomerase
MKIATAKTPPPETRPTPNAIAGRPVFGISSCARLWCLGWALSLGVAPLMQAAEAPKAAGASLPGAARSRFADLFDDPVIARGQGVQVKQSELEEAFISFKANLAARGQSVPEDQRLFREAQLLERLIVTQILTKRAADADKTVAKEAAAKFVAETKKSQSEDAFQRTLKSLGITLEQFDQRVYDQALAEAVVARELKSKITISDAQVESFYRTGGDILVDLLQEELERVAKNPNASIDQLTGVKRRMDETRKANLARLEQPEKVRVSHVLLATRHRDTERELPEEQQRAKRVQMDRILARARAGEDFGKLVSEYSEDRNVKETKGEYTFSRDDRFVAEFKAAAFSLEPGKISDIVTTIYGYHILKLHERIAPRKVELAKAAPEIREHLLQQELQRRMPDYFRGLKKEARVEILDARYRIDPPKDIETLKPAG